MTDVAVHNPSATPKPSDLLISAQVCAMLKIDPSTLTRRVARGQDPQPVGKLPGPTGAFLFARADVERVASKTDDVCVRVGDVVTRGKGKTRYEVTSIDDRFIRLDPLDGYTGASVVLEEAHTLHQVVES